MYTCLLGLTPVSELHTALRHAVFNHDINLLLDRGLVLRAKHINTYPVFRNLPPSKVTYYFVRCCVNPLDIKRWMWARYSLDVREMKEYMLDRQLKHPHEYD